MKTLHNLIPKLANHRILVLGDVILDEYVTGRAERISREAPIPVLEFVSRQYIPGGAANPASNIVTLGSKVIQVGIVGDDDAAANLKQELERRGIETAALVTVNNKPTTLKTRILAQMGLRFPQQVARVDTLSRENISENIAQEVLDVVQSQIAQVDAMLISDYHNGLLTQDVVQQVKVLAQTANVPLFVDAQGHLEKYQGFDVVKCNADDAKAFLQRELKTSAEYDDAATELFSRLELKQAMVITRGGNGATIANGGVEHVPAPHVSDVYDTVGAGDTWIAVFTLACVASASLTEAGYVGEYCQAGLWCGMSAITHRHLMSYYNFSNKKNKKMNHKVTKIKLSA